MVAFGLLGGDDVKAWALRVLGCGLVAFAVLFGAILGITCGFRAGSLLVKGWKAADAVERALDCVEPEPALPAGVVRK